MACTDHLPDDFETSTFINLGLNLCEGIERHHRAEEHWLYPILARRMPAFQEELKLSSQHKDIHTGLTKLHFMLSKYKHAQKSFSLPEVKVCMDEFGEVLWQHMNEELAQLAPDELKMHWTVDEIEQEVNNYIAR
jgi:glutamate-1-semialdehyde aminotransferase